MYSQFHSSAIVCMYKNQLCYRTVVYPSSRDYLFGIRLYLQRHTNIFSTFLECWLYAIYFRMFKYWYLDCDKHSPTHASTTLSIVKPFLHSHRNDPSVLMQFWLLSQAVLSTVHSSISNLCDEKCFENSFYHIKKLSESYQHTYQNAVCILLSRLNSFLVARIALFLF